MRYFSHFFPLVLRPLRAPRHLSQQSRGVRAYRVSFPGPWSGAGSSAGPGSRSTASDAWASATLELRGHQLGQRTSFRQHRQKRADKLIVVMRTPTIVHLNNKINFSQTCLEMFVLLSKKELIKSAKLVYKSISVRCSKPTAH